MLFFDIWSLNQNKSISGPLIVYFRFTTSKFSDRAMNSGLPLGVFSARVRRLDDPDFNPEVPGWSDVISLSPGESFFFFCSSHQPVPILFSASFSSTHPIFFAAASASSAVSPSLFLCGDGDRLNRDRRVVVVSLRDEPRDDPIVESSLSLRLW